MKIGVIIPFYNGHRYLERLVQSFDQSAHENECALFVIDNSPGDHHIELPVTTRLTVEVIDEKPAIGYGKACNRGYQICRERQFDYIIVCNQDAYVSQDFVSEILSPFRKDPEIIIAAPMLKTYDGNQIEDFFLKYYLSQAPEIVTDLIAGNCKAFYSLDKISGACFAFDLKNVKYRFPYFFDPIYHMYSEDDDLCYRVKQIGGKIVLVVPHTTCFHQHSATTDRDNEENIRFSLLLSENILRLKNMSKGFEKALYGVFVTTTSSSIYHLLRAEFKKAYQHLHAFGVILWKLPAIKRSRRTDISVFQNSKK